MKNKLIILALTLLFICAGALNVEASSLEADEDAGNNVYSFDFVSWSVVMSDPSGYYDGCIGYGSATFEGYKVCGYKCVIDDDDNLYDRCWIELYVYNDNGYYSKGSGLTGLVSDYATSSVGSVTFGYFNSETLKFDYESSKNPTTIYSSLVGDLYWREVADYQFHDVAKLATNVPIFSSQEQAVAFMKGEIDESYAVNYDDLHSIISDSDEVPIPRNVQVIEENNKYYLLWEQTTEDLESISTVRLAEKLIGESYKHEEGKAYPAYVPKLKETYAAALSHKIDITDCILNLRTYYRDNGVDEYKSTLTFVLRNIWEKSLLERHVSTEVHANLTISYSDRNGFKVDVSYTELDSDGNYVPDSDYNDVYDDPNLGEDNFTVGGIGSSTDIRELLYFFKEMFMCFPDFIFERLEFGIYAMVIVVLFKLLVS